MSTPSPRRRRPDRWYEDEPDRPRRPRRRPAEPEDDVPERPQLGDRWSTWDESSPAERGPEPYPGWLVTDPAAVDTELGVLKTGKEADVHLLERAVPGGAACLLAAKRYRGPEHRLFHRDEAYLEGRRVRRSRETRAMARRTAFGRQLIAGQWARAEFDALCRLWRATSAGVPPIVPYPVQLLGTELLLEFIGDHATGHAAPRLAQLRPGPRLLRDLWWQVVAAMTQLARLGLAHGDLSPYNLLVHADRVVLIDLPQVVELVSNPHGPELLARDVRVICDWFATRGYPDLDWVVLYRELCREAGLAG